MELQSRPVKPAQAIVIILVFGALLAGWLVARGNMLATPMPTHMTVLPEARQNWQTWHRVSQAMIAIFVLPSGPTVAARTTTACGIRNKCAST